MALYTTLKTIFNAEKAYRAEYIACLKSLNIFNQGDKITILLDKITIFFVILTDRTKLQFFYLTL